MSNCCSILLFLFGIAHFVAADLIDMDLFKAGDLGYVCFRLPNLVQMRTPGHLVAFGQGRTLPECPDSGPMDSFVRTSVDNGVTWTPPSLVYPNKDRQTMGTPTAIVDHSTDTIFLFLNPQHGGHDAKDGRRVLLLNSTDCGHSWSEPWDMTSELVEEGWDNVWMGTQQGIAVELPGGKTRLIMCANHHGTSSNGAHTVYSDNHGLTWQNGHTLSSPASLGECALAQTSAGVFMYGRVVIDNPNITTPRRSLAFSSDYGRSFAAGRTDAFPGNPGADCEGAFMEFGGKFLVASPFGAVSPANPSRHNYTVLVSDAVDGKPTTWHHLPGADPLSPGIEAEYSTMQVPSADNSTVFVLYERGDIYQEGVGPKSSLRLTQLKFP